MEKFGHRDNKVLFNSLQHILQIKEKIENICVEQKLTPTELPMSMVPSAVLYDIVACYEAMYNTLLTKELLKCGFTKSPPTYH